MIWNLKGQSNEIFDLQFFVIMLYSRNKRESSGGVSIVYFTTNIWKTTRQCTYVITLRRSAMSVKFHYNCLLCFGLASVSYKLSLFLDKLQLL